MFHPERYKYLLFMKQDLYELKNANACVIRIDFSSRLKIPRRTRMTVKINVDYLKIKKRALAMPSRC
jgi:hypothetical protein